jgi:hypothetical protein
MPARRPSARTGKACIGSRNAGGAREEGPEVATEDIGAKRHHHGASRRSPARRRDPPRCPETSTPPTVPRTRPSSRAGETSPPMVRIKALPDTLRGGRQPVVGEEGDALFRGGGRVWGASPPPWLAQGGTMPPRAAVLPCVQGWRPGRGSRDCGPARSGMRSPWSATMPCPAATHPKFRPVRLDGSPGGYPAAAKKLVAPMRGRC